MNAAMRGAASVAEVAKWRPFIYHIHAALQQLPGYSLTQLYRSINCSVSGYDEGTFVRWDAFSSSTTDPDIVKGFASDGGTIFILKPRPNSQGHLIHFLSEFKEVY